jgi:hypothetical protein
LWLAAIPAEYDSAKKTIPIPTLIGDDLGVGIGIGIGIGIDKRARRTPSFKKYFISSVEKHDPNAMHPIRFINYDGGIG